MLDETAERAPKPQNKPSSPSCLRSGSAGSRYSAAAGLAANGSVLWGWDAAVGRLSRPYL